MNTILLTGNLVNSGNFCECTTKTNSEQYANIGQQTDLDNLLTLCGYGFSCQAYNYTSVENWKTTPLCLRTVDLWISVVLKYIFHVPFLLLIESLLFYAYVFPITSLDCRYASLASRLFGVRLLECMQNVAWHGFTEIKPFLKKMQFEWCSKPCHYQWLCVNASSLVYMIKI